MSQRNSELKCPKKGPPLQQQHSIIIWTTGTGASSAQMPLPTTTGQPCSRQEPSSAVRVQMASPEARGEAPPEMGTIPFSPMYNIFQCIFQGLYIYACLRNAQVTIHILGHSYTWLYQSMLR